MNQVNSAVGNVYEGVAFDNILKCVHCGLCLDSCPTYRESGLEQDSPRGRLFIMNGVWRGKMAFNEQNVQFLNRCIDCRACETACPSKVPYGELIEKTRGILYESDLVNKPAKVLQSFFFTKVLPNGAALKSLSVLFKMYGALGVNKLITKTPLKKILPDFTVKGQYMLPKFAGSSFKDKFAGSHLPLDSAAPNATVALFTGCIADVSDHDVQSATVRLLKRANCRVLIIKNQRCCGALQVHGGDRATGRELAADNINAFTAHNPDKIITNAGGCSAQLREYHLLLEKGAVSAEKVRDFESKITDILEFLANVDGFVDRQTWHTEPDTVLYDAPCHLIHAQKIDRNPRRLLASLPGVTLAPLCESEWCCGSGGIYNLLQSELADQVLERKMDSIKRALEKYPQAHTLVSGNPGCLFQIRYGVERHKLPLRVIHPAVYMAERLKSRKV